MNITQRNLKRKLTNGKVVVQHRYVLNFSDPKTGERAQRFFKRLKEAQDAQREITVEIAQGRYSDRRTAPTIAELFDHWIENRRGEVKTFTLDGYERHRAYIVGPLLIGTKKQRAEYTLTGIIPEGCGLQDMLGHIKIADLSTAEIRSWHRKVADSVGAHSARRATSYLKTLLALAAEDFDARPPLMPKKMGRGGPKVKKDILTPDQVATLLDYARGDRDYGAYIAFPFLTGVRPSEQLGLLWCDVDFEKREIHIRRMQERDGSITDCTKTEAGTRTIPMPDMLAEILGDWKSRCPMREGRPNRVFPNIGFLAQWPKPRKGGGNCLLYGNFRKRVWSTALKKAGLPYVKPHSARHFFISVLQAQGAEIGLVSKMAGHANPSITLGHYTQAVRGGREIMEAFANSLRPKASVEEMISKPF